MAERSAPKSAGPERPSDPTPGVGAKLPTPTTPMSAHSKTLIFVTICALAWNMRLAPIMIGPVLPDLRVEFGMSSTVAGLLTAMPTFCFAIFGLSSPHLSRVLGVHGALWLAIVMNAGGQVMRITTNQTGIFLLGSAFALAGIGIINILLTALVKQHYEARNGIMTATYSTIQAVATALAGMTTAPLAISMGSWRGPYWIWAATSLMAVIPMSMVIITRRSPRAPSSPTRLSTVARTRLGWMMALFFGSQSAQAYAMFGWMPSIYQEAGFSPTQAGFFLFILNAIVAPVTFIVPVLTHRLGRPVPIVIVSAILLATGFSGLAFIPATLPWAWPAIVALGSGSFPMILTLVGMKARTPEGTTTLSSFAQSVGYLFASLFPLAVGVLHQVTGTFTLPVILHAFLAIPLLIAGLYSARAGFIEDEIAVAMSKKR